MSLPSTSPSALAMFPIGNMVLLFLSTGFTSLSYSFPFTIILFVSTGILTTLSLSVRITVLVASSHSTLNPSASATNLIGNMVLLLSINGAISIITFCSTPSTVLVISFDPITSFDCSFIFTLVCGCGVVVVLFVTDDPK